MNRTIKVLLITFIAFGLFYLIDEWYFSSLRTIINQLIHQVGVSHIITYVTVGIPVFTGAFFIAASGKYFHNLGLKSNIFNGLLLALLFTLPMFLGFAIIFQLDEDLNINLLLMGVVAAAFFEELYFRGFLFGQIFRNTKIGFIPSVLIGAVLFALAHLYQSQDFGTLIGIFIMTFLGAFFFAWVYCEWNYNLWVAVFLHLFMNLSWMMFSVSDNALGGKYANIFRVLTIALTITFTVIYKIRKNKKFEINKKTLWMKH